MGEVAVSENLIKKKKYYQILSSSEDSSDSSTEFKSESSSESTSTSTDLSPSGVKKTWGKLQQATFFRFKKKRSSP